MTSPVVGSNLSIVGSGMGSLWLEKILCSSKELQQENTIYLVWAISITKCTDYSFPRIRLLQKFHKIPFEFCARISQTGLYPLLLCKETFKSESVCLWSVRFFCHKNGGLWTSFEAARREKLFLLFLPYSWGTMKYKHISLWISVDCSNSTKPLTAWVVSPPTIIFFKKQWCFSFIAIQLAWS